MQKNDATYKKGGGDSSYAKRKAQRRSWCGGSDNPLPRGLIDPKYYPMRGTKHETRNAHMVPLPFERAVKETQEKPVKEILTKTIKYNHFNMNYTGWNS